MASDGVPLVFFFWGGVGGVFQQHSSWVPPKLFSTLPPIIMDAEMGPSNISFLSFRVPFHFP